GGAQLVELIALTYTAPERLLPFAGEVIQYRSGCPSCMACGGVVDGDMQAEVMGIDTQLGELVGADQQVQGKLLVAEIEADDFRQEFAGKLPQSQLQRALEETVVRQGFQVLDVLAGDEVAIDEDMVLIRLAIAQLLQIGAHQVMHARVVPLLQHAVQPGAIDQLGRGNVAQEIQCMGAIGEEAPGLALAAGLDVFPVGPGGAGALHQNRGLEPGGTFRQVGQMRGGQLQLAAQEVPRLAEVVRAADPGTARGCRCYRLGTGSVSAWSYPVRWLSVSSCV